MAETSGELPGGDSADTRQRVDRADRAGPDGNDGSADGSGESLREAKVSVSRADEETIGIAKLVDRWQAAGLRRSETIACREDGPVVQVSVADPLDPAALRSLAVVETVDPPHRGTYKLTR